MQAWLDAYYGSNSQCSNQILDSGTVEARAGSIQAAINLELQSFDLRFINVKIEGLNGQLPNLDLVNLCQRLAAKMGIVSGHQQTNEFNRGGATSSWQDNFQHMFSMILTQSTGVPNGNHGLFFRYGIQAVTLEGHQREQSNHRYRSTGAIAILKLIEGITRSLNNLLERFHQSFFFYLLVASDRFVSIGDYTPSLALIVTALLIKAFITWLSINQRSSILVEDVHDSDDNAGDKKKKKKSEKHQDEWQPEEQFEFISVAKYLIVAHVFGALAAYLPFVAPLDTVFHEYGFKTEIYLFFMLLTLSLVSLTIPLLFSFNAINIEVRSTGFLHEMNNTFSSYK